MINFDKTIRKSFNVDFCKRLEYHLSRAFRNSNDKQLKRIWCDGVREPESWQQNLEVFNETKEVVTGAWLGVAGQDEYKMVICLGNQSFERCLNGLGFEEFLPGDESLDWVDIDMPNRKIVLQLL